MILKGRVVGSRDTDSRWSNISNRFLAYPINRWKERQTPSQSELKQIYTNAIMDQQLKMKIR